MDVVAVVVVVVNTAMMYLDMCRVILLPKACSVV
jgi:hypothetical protein